MADAVSYYQRRAAEEAARARACADASVAKVHDELARLYRARATDAAGLAPTAPEPKIAA